jgi:hypothetical protein
MRPRRREAPFLLALVLLSACQATAEMPALSPRASAVGVDQAPPAPGSRELGPVLGEHGVGCGFTGKKGSYAGAEAVLRDRTADMGGDYARVLEVEPPTHTTDCMGNRWVIHAVAYRSPFAPSGVPAVPSAPSAPEPAAAPPAVVTPPPAPAPVSQDCAPPCSPGYACSAGACLALCNPPCGAGQTCRQDRTCGPAR